MNKHLLLVALLLSVCLLNAQTLPELDVPVTSKNYFDICRQLDGYFEKEYVAEEDGCWDNEEVKYRRWKWFWRDRVNPDGSFPDLKEQWLEHRRLTGAVQSRGNQPVWLNEGPTQNPASGYWGMGRTKHVAIHPADPSTLYVGTPDGGIWKTQDGGATWAALGDGLPYLPVAVILIDHQHPDTLYISLGDKGGWWQRNLGVYKSTDGGITWTPTALDWSLDEFKVIYEMIMSPADPNVIFAATNSGILRTTDGGASWQTLRAGEYTDIQFRPGDPATLYAAHHDYWNKSQIVKSTDGGDTWTPVTNFDVTNNTLNLAVTSANPDWVGVRFSQGRQFWLSKDGGASFQFRSEMPEDAHFAFSQVDTNIIYTSGVVVHRSVDQGFTWDAITHWYNDGVHDEVHADVHDIVPNPLNPNEIYFCNDGGLYRYDEPSENWVDLSEGLGIAQFYRIAVSEQGPLKIGAGSQDNGGWFRAPNGYWKHTNGGDAMCQAIDPTNGNVLYTEYYGGKTIYRSINNFFSYTVISDNIADAPSGDWVTPFLLNPQNPNTFLVGFHDLYRSFDRGDHFHKISENLTGNVDTKIRDVAYAPSDTNFILATAGNRVYKTVNGGQNWSSYVVPGGGEDITRVAIHPGNPQRVWATVGGYSAGKKVYRSINGGQVWGNISANLPNVPVNCILYDSLTNYLFIGTDIGVFYTDANDIFWQPYGQGMPNVYVLDLKIRQATRILYAGTHGRGLYSVPLDLLVGTGEQAEQPESEVTVYPNPARTALFFKTGSARAVDGQVQLLGVDGRVVASRVLAAQSLDQVSLDVSRLPEGMYFLKITDGKGGPELASKVMVRR